MSLSVAIILPLLTIAAPAAASPAPMPSCAHLSLTSFPACRLTRSGVVFAADAAEADAAAAAANQGEQSFIRHIGPVPRYAVLVGSDIAAAQTALRRAGYPVVLPWLNAATRKQGLEESVRRSTEAQLSGKGLSQERIDAAVTQALSQIGGQRSDRLVTSYSAVAHELGHLWLMHSFWSTRAPQGRGAATHYGGPGPDWLDEAAAIAMEDETLSGPRRTRFADLWAGRVPGKVETLARFFATDHPLKGVGELVRSGQVGSGAGGVTVLTGEEVQSRLGVGAEAAPNFYAQARAVADFLIERSRNPRILGEIARGLSRGQSMQAWLAAHGRQNRLGRNLAELEVQWRAWGAAKFR